MLEAEFRTTDQCPDKIMKCRLFFFGTFFEIDVHDSGLFLVGIPGKNSQIQLVSNLLRVANFCQAYRKILGTITDPPQNPIAATHEKCFASCRLKCSIRLSSLIVHIDNKIVQ